MTDGAMRTIHSDTLVEVRRVQPCNRLPSRATIRTRHILAPRAEANEASLAVACLW